MCFVDLSLGVLPCFIEDDEIEADELLVISFSASVYVEDIYLTDLFDEDGYLETGYFQLDGSTTQQFWADSGSSPNGDKVLHVGDWVTEISFWAPGLLNGADHEFSVAGLSVNPMPEPASAVLFGVGSLVVGYATRRHRRRT